MNQSRWVQREPYIGAVLCTNDAEEQKLLLDWEEEKTAKAEKLAEEARKTAEAAAGLSSVQLNKTVDEDDEEEPKKTKKTR